MIVTIVSFPLGTQTPEQMTALFEGSAERYTRVPGLQRKYYGLTEDGSRGFGIYLWDSRADAERLYDDAWRAYIRERYGEDPQITWLDCPVVVDNVVHQILTAAGVQAVAATA